MILMIFCYSYILVPSSGFIKDATEADGSRCRHSQPNNRKSSESHSEEGDEGFQHPEERKTTREQSSWNQVNKDHRDSQRLKQKFWNLHGSVLDVYVVAFSLGELC